MEKKTRSNFCSTFCIIGFPDEIAIHNVHGRLGAKEGPAAFLEAFKKLNGKNWVQEKMIRSELVPMGQNLEKNYEVASLSVKAAAHHCLIAVGGGHDYAYPWIHGLTAMSKKKKNIGCINIDAHFDLRTYEPQMTSGSPFRRLIEENIIQGKNLVEFGVQDHCNAPELWKYASEKKVKTISFSELRNGAAVKQFKKALNTLRSHCDEVVISLDLDALSLAYCPGVSAPQGEGFTAGEIYEILEIAGRDKKVTSLGIFELSPPLDLQNQTARVAAQSAWHFLNAKLFS